MALKSPLECQVCFVLGSEEYGVPAANINKIISVPEINKLPNTADYLLGVIKLKGVIIPIIDLKKKLTGVSTDMTEDCRIIIMEISYSQVGMLVDKLGAHFGYDCTQLVPLGNTKSNVPEEYVLGIADLHSRLVKILNCGTLLG